MYVCVCDSARAFEADYLHQEEEDEEVDADSREALAKAATWSSALLASSKQQWCSLELSHKDSLANVRGVWLARPPAC